MTSPSARLTSDDLALARIRPLDEEGAIVELRLDRPDARNALSLELVADLRTGLERIGGDPSVRVIVLAAEGRAFCAGMDLKALRREPTRMGDLLMAISRLAREIRRARVPVIAQVQGAAVGGGCGLATVCDFAFTHAEAKIGYPEVGLGVCPAVVAPWLIRKIGAGPARRLLLTGGTIAGREALEIGLVTHLAERDSLEDATLELARHLARGGPNAMAVTKRWLNELDGSLDDDVLDEAARLSAEVVQGEEAQSRLAALFDAG